MTSAGNPATDFNNAAASLQTQDSNLNLGVVQDVGQVNSLTTQIASVDQQIASQENASRKMRAPWSTSKPISSGASGTQLTCRSCTGPSRNQIPTPLGGTTLVAGNQSFALTTATGAGGNQKVSAGTQNLTSGFTEAAWQGQSKFAIRKFPASPANSTSWQPGSPPRSTQPIRSVSI